MPYELSVDEVIAALSRIISWPEDGFREKFEEELSPGDTKLLDEYLHSFVCPGA